MHDSEIEEHISILKNYVAEQECARQTFTNERVRGALGELHELILSSSWFNHKPKSTTSQNPKVQTVNKLTLKCPNCSHNLFNMDVS